MAENNEEKFLSLDYWRGKPLKELYDAQETAVEFFDFSVADVIEKVIQELKDRQK